MERKNKIGVGLLAAVAIAGTGIALKKCPEAEKKPEQSDMETPDAGITDGRLPHFRVEFDAERIPRRFIFQEPVMKAKPPKPLGGTGDGEMGLGRYGEPTPGKIDPATATIQRRADCNNEGITALIDCGMYGTEVSPGPVAATCDPSQGNEEAIRETCRRALLSIPPEKNPCADVWKTAEDSCNKRSLKNRNKALDRAIMFSAIVENIERGEPVDPHDVYFFLTELSFAFREPRNTIEKDAFISDMNLVGISKKELSNAILALANNYIATETDSPESFDVIPYSIFLAIGLVKNPDGEWMWDHIPEELQ